MSTTLAAPTTPAVGEVDLDRVDALVEATFNATLPALDRINHVDRRTRNRLRTRGQILRTAWRLFLTVGYEQTTIQDITDAADIGKGTFFSHFSKKSDVALYLCAHRRSMVIDLYRRGAFGDGSAASRIERMMVTFAGLNGDDTPEARLMTDIVLRQFFAEPGLMGPDQPTIEVTLQELFEDGVASGELPKDTDCAAGARLLHASFYSAKAEWLRTGPHVVPFNLATRVRDDVRVILRGLR